MQIDWLEVENLVKPCPNYNVLIKDLQEVFSYVFIREAYNQTPKQALEYSKKLFGCDPKQRYGEAIKRVTCILEKLEKIGIKNNFDFISQVETKEKLEAFYQKYSITVQEIVGFLKYLSFWLLPSKIYLRELVESDDNEYLAYVTTLRQDGIRYNLDILEQGRTKEDRENISIRTGIPKNVIYDLASRADLTRMPWVRGRNIKHYVKTGYANFDKLAKINPEIIHKEMASYFKSIGKNMKLAIDLDSHIEYSKFFPKVIDPDI